MNPTLADEIKRKWIGLKMAERASGLDKVNKSHAVARRIAKKQQDGTLGQPTDEPMDEQEDGMINVGDTQITYTSPPQGGSGTNPLLLAAALLLGGASLPIVGEYVLNKLKPSPASGKDTDTQYELRISSGEK